VSQLPIGAPARENAGAKAHRGGEPMLFLGGGGTFAISSALPAHSTPLGSHANEFCALDRAMIFEDPDGTRILYDAGRTARGPEDPRLGNINVVLLSHVHGDHLGDVIQPSPNVGECGKPDFSVKVTPKSNTVNIVVAKKAQLVVGSEMASFLAKKIGRAGDNLRNRNWFALALRARSAVLLSLRCPRCIAMVYLMPS
jgi:hypothetical protein